MTIRSLPWLLLGTTALPAQLVTTDAGVLSPTLVSVRERLEWFAREHADEAVSLTSIAWAPERRLQLELGLPLLAREVDVPASGGPRRGRQEGLGDLELGAKWALLREDAVMRSDRLSVLADLRLPTGDDDRRVDGQDLGPRAGLGLGTYGGALGLGYTLVRDRHRAAAALRGWTWASDDGFAPGDAVSLDLAWWYRLSPAAFVVGDDTIEWRGVLELLGRWQGDDRLAGAGLGNGGLQGTIVLGVQANLDRACSLEAGVLLPLVDDTESVFGELRHGLLVSFRMLF